MAKAKVHLTGVEKLISDIERQQTITPTIIRKGLKMAGKEANKSYSRVMDKHRFTGLTEDSIVENPIVKTKGNKITCQTGFDISKGGAPSIWLDRGTPSQDPTHFMEEVKNDPAVKSIIDLIMEETMQ